MFKRILLLTLLSFACAAPNATDDAQSQPRLIDQELNEYTLTTEKNSDDFRLQLNEQGLVRISFLKINGQEYIKNNVWQADAQQKNWRFAWKSWQGEQVKLLWLELIDAAELYKKQGFYLTRMGIPLQAHGLYSVEVKIFQEKKVIASQKLQFTMNTQRYYGNGVGGRITDHEKGVAASLFAVDPKQASVAFSQSDSHGNFYLKYKYRGHYRVFVFNEHSFSTTQMLLHELKGEGKIYHHIELETAHENAHQAWFLSPESKEAQKLEDAKLVEIVLGADVLGSAVLIGAIAKDGRLSWQYFSQAQHKVSLEVDPQIDKDPQAILFVLQQGKVPFSRWLHKDGAINASQNLGLGTQDQPFDESEIKESIDLQLDVSKFPDISMQRRSFVDAGSTLLLSATANSGLRSWQWFINGSFFGNDVTTVYQVPNDYKHDKLFIRVKVDDHWNNTFEREYHLAVRKSGVIWEAETAPPYWLAVHGLDEQKFNFRAQFIGASDLLAGSKQRFHWYLEDASQPHDQEAEADFTTDSATPLALQFDKGGYYRLRVEAADEPASSDALRLAYESEFLVKSPLSGLEITGEPVAKALSKTQFSAVVANFDVQQNEKSELSYNWYIDDKLVQRFPELIELNDDHKSLIYHNKKLRTQPEKHLLRLEVSNGFYPEPLQAEYSFTTEAVQSSFEIVHDLARNNPDYTYLLAEEQSFKAIFNQAQETIDTASLNYSWNLFMQEGEDYREVDETTLALWQEDEQQLLLNFLEPGNYRLTAQVFSSLEDSEIKLEDEFFFRINAKLEALHFEFNKKEIAAAETLVLEAKVTNIEAQKLDGDRLSYRWFYWKNGRFAEEERLELDAKNLAVGFRLISDSQLELRVDPLLGQDSQWQFQVELSDHVYPDSLISAKETFQFKKSDWSLSLETAPFDHYRIERLLKVHAKLDNLATTFAQPLVYQWQLELFDTDQGVYRAALLQGREAEMDAENSSLSLVFSSAGSYRLRCNVELEGYENQKHLRSQELIFELNHPPDTLQLVAPKQSLKAGESLKITAKLNNLAAQIAEKDTLIYRWQQFDGSQFTDIDFNNLAPEFQFNEKKNELQLAASITLADPKDYAFRVTLKDSVYDQEIESNVLKVALQPAETLIEIEHLTRKEGHVFLISHEEEFKAVVKNLPPSLSADSFSYNWSLQHGSGGAYEDLQPSVPDTLAQNSDTFRFAPLKAVPYRLLLQAVYSDEHDSREFLAHFDFSVKPPLTEVQIKADAQKVKVGETLSFTALIDNEEEEQADLLSYRWQLKTAKGDFVDLLDDAQWTVDNKKLQFHPPLELALREEKVIRVIVNDGLYPQELASKEFDFDVLPLDLVLSIKEPEEPLKLATVLTFKAQLENLIPQLSEDMFSYLWQVQVAGAAVHSNKAELIEDKGQKISLKFSESGDYQLHLKATYGQQDVQRELSYSLALHLNHPPQTLSINSDKKQLEAGESVTLNALLSNVQQQKDEDDQLSYRWQLKTQAGKEFHNLDPDVHQDHITFPARFSVKENTLQLSVLPSLAADELWQLRAIVKDTYEQESVSQPFELNLQAADIKVDMIMPAKPLKINNSYTFSAKVENLPATLSYGELNYFWDLQQQDAQEKWQSVTAKIDDREQHTFTHAFQKGGEYKLQLRLTLGTSHFQRSLKSEEKIFRVDHPPQNLTLERLPAQGLIKAGDRIELIASLENLVAQKDDANSLTWVWERLGKDNQWQALQNTMLPQGSSMSDNRLLYQLQPTLARAGKETLRITLNDGVYKETLSSEPVTFEYQAARLQPQIIVPKTKHKVGEPLVVSAELLPEQLPQGIKEEDLSYLWSLQQQDFNGDWQKTKKGFSADKLNESIFQPTFEISGDYRLQLELSFADALGRREFVVTEKIHLNHRPSTPVIKVVAGTPSMKAGGVLELQASFANLLQQEEKELTWLWQRKTSSADWLPFKEIVATTLEEQKLAYKIPLTLAQDESSSFRVQVSDGLYKPSAYSNEITLNSQAVQLTPQIILPSAPYKIAEDLHIKALIDEQQLPLGLSLNDLNYSWQLQKKGKDGQWLQPLNNFSASAAAQESFAYQFQESGDYRLELAVSFARAESERRFSTAVELHLNNRVATPALTSSFKADVIKAGNSFTLSASIANQLEEEDELRWIWQLKKNEQEWQLLNSTQLTSLLEIKDHILLYRVPASLEKDETLSFRVQVSDAVYKESPHSNILTLQLQASHLDPSITLPEKDLRIEELLKFQAKINAEHLATGIELEQLRYNWELKEQQSASWQPLDKSLANLVNSKSHTLAVFFKESGDYELRLKVSFADAVGQREFVATEKIHLNHRPSTPVIKVVAGGPSMKAGGVLELQASFANLLEQEEKELTWLWQRKTSSADWLPFKEIVATTLEEQKLVYKIPLTLAQDESSSFRVQVSDGLYEASAYSNEITLNSQAVQLTPQIILPSAPYKIAEDLHLKALIDEQQLPLGLSLKDLSYSWQLQKKGQDGQWLQPLNNFSASAAAQESFAYQFQESGDYRLELAVSFARAESERRFSTAVELHLNNRVATPALTSSFKADVIKAGNSFTLSASIANQLEEEDELRWIWQLKKNEQEWQLLNSTQLTSLLEIKDHTLLYRVPASLEKDETLSFRVQVSDAVYKESPHSNILTLQLQASHLDPSITLPEKDLRIEELLKFQAKINAEHLATGIEPEQLRYNWEIKEQQSASWQPLDKSLANLVNSKSHTLGAFFKESGDYELRLQVSFADALGRREFVATKKIHLNHRPNTPVIKVVAGAPSMKAGGVLELQASFANLLEQEEKELTWLWQRKTSSADWLPFKEIVATTLEEQKLVYKIPLTLAQDESSSFRVQVSDGLYEPSAYSNEITLNSQAVQLTPQIILPSAPYKIAEDLHLKALIDEQQLPLGLSLKDLSYSWQLQKKGQDGQWLQPLHNFATLAAAQESFAYQFQESGDYRLDLAVSFARAESERRFSTAVELHLNHPPQSLSLTSSLEEVAAGETLRLQALALNEEQEEGDEFIYLWRYWKHGKSAIQDAIVLDFDNLAEGFSSNKADSLSLQVDPALALNDEWRFQVGVSDTTYYPDRWLWSKTEKIELTKSNWQLSLTTPAEDKYVLDHLFPVQAQIQNLAQVAKESLAYEWQLQKAEKDAENKIAYRPVELTGANAEAALMPQDEDLWLLFFSAGDYRLTCQASFRGYAKQESSRIAYLPFQLNHPPQGLTLTTSKTQAKPTETIELQARLANLEQQKLEGDKISYFWQQRLGTKFVDISTGNALDEFEFKSKEAHKMSFTPPAALKNRSYLFRVAVQDSNYPYRLNSAPVVVLTEAAAMKVAIKHLSKNNEHVFMKGKAETFRAIVENLATDIVEQTYQWQLQIAKDGFYQTASQEDADNLRANTKDYTFTLESAADYRLLLTAVYKDRQSQSRSFQNSFEFKVNRPLAKVEIESRARNVKAAESLQLKALLSNAEAQQGDTISYIWQEEISANVFQDIKASEQWLIAGNTLTLRVPLHLAAAEKRVLRVLANDGHYRKNCVSEAIELVMQPLNLHFDIKKTHNVSKTQEALKFMIEYSEFPQKLDKDSLNYLWQLFIQKDDGSWQKDSSQLKAPSYTQETFTPIFKEGGNYRLRLQLRYGPKNEQRLLEDELDFKINHPPANITLRTSAVEIKAGETLVLSADLENIAQQQQEGDHLSYNWQQRRAGERKYQTVQSSVFNVHRNDEQLSLVVEPGLKADEKWEFTAVVGDKYGQKSVSAPLLLTFKAAKPQLEIKKPNIELLSGKNYNFIAQLKNLPKNLDQDDLDYTWNIEHQLSKKSFVKSDEHHILIVGNHIQKNILTTQFLHGGTFRIRLKVAYGKKLKNFVESLSEIHINHKPSSLQLNFEPRLQELQAGSSIAVKATLDNFAQQQAEHDTLVWSWMVRRGSQPFRLLDTKKASAEFRFSSEQQLHYTPSLSLPADEEIEFHVALNDAHYPALNSQKSLKIRALTLEPSISLAENVAKIGKDLSFQARISEDKIPKDKNINYQWRVLYKNEKKEWQDAKKDAYQLKKTHSKGHLLLNFKKHGEFKIALQLKLGTTKDKVDFNAEQSVRIKAPPLPRLLDVAPHKVLEAGETLELHAKVAAEASQNKEDEASLTWLWQMKNSADQDWQDLNTAALKARFRIRENRLSYRIPLALKADEKCSFRVKVDDGIYDAQLSESAAFTFKAVKLKPSILLPHAPYKIDQSLIFQASIPQNKIPQTQQLNYDWTVEKETSQDSWQKLKARALSIKDSRQESLELRFPSAGSYRLHVLVSFQEGQTKREFSAFQKIWVNHRPTELTLQRQPASGDIFGGQELNFIATMSNLEKHLSDDQDQLTWTWQRAIILAAETLKEDDFEMLKHKERQISYTPALSQNKEKKLYYRLAFSDGVYDVKKVTSEAVLLKPLDIEIKILSAGEDAALGKYRPNRDYQFRFALEPQLPHDVDINYTWSLLGNGDVVDSQREAPLFSFKGHTKYKLSFLLSYTSEGRKRQLRPKVIKINVNAPPRGVAFSAQQIKSNGQRLNIDVNKYKLIEIASNDKLVLRPTIANIEKQKREGDTIDYRWLEKSAFHKTGLERVQFTLVDVSKAGYSQDSDGVLTVDAATMDLEGKKYRSFICEAQDSVYKEWKKSSIGLRTNIQITPSSLDLKANLANGNTKSVSQDSQQPSPITTLEKTDYSASLYDPDSLIRSFTLRNSKQMNGILVFSKEFRASDGGKLKTFRQLKLGSADKDGYRHAHFQLNINRSSSFNIPLILTATGNGNKLQSKFYLQRINAQPHGIEIFQGKSKLSSQRVQASIIPMGPLHEFNKNLAKVLEFSLHFKDPNHLVKQNWKLELIEGQQATLLGNSPYQDIIYSFASHGKNDEKDGNRRIIFNLGFKHTFPKDKVLQIRASLSSNGGSSYPVSEDFYMQREAFTPSEWKFYQRNINAHEEVDTLTLNEPSLTTGELFVKINDPDSQVKSVQLAYKMSWVRLSKPRVLFNTVPDKDGYRVSEPFAIEVIDVLYATYDLKFKLNAVAGAKEEIQNLENRLIIITP